MGIGCAFFRVDEHVLEQAADANYPTAAATSAARVGETVQVWLARMREEEHCAIDRVLSDLPRVEQFQGWDREGYRVGTFLETLAAT